VNKPKHIFLIVADSLRKDAVYTNGIDMPYVEANSIQYTQARSSACWTLPATSCMFTGLNVHEHRADTHTRKLRQDIPTLAEHMKSKGYKTIQVTANPVTTDIFGLDRGFDEIHKVWKLVTPKLKKTMRLMLSIGKPRVRKMLFSKDAISEKLSSDLEVANCWGQNTHLDSFNKVKQLIEENDAKNQPCFFFINLMETHFPYHIADTFQLSGKSLYDKAMECITLFKIVNQNFLIKDEPVINQKYADLIYQRQMTSYQIIKNDLNQFVESIHRDQDNLVVFCSDHGDNFGEMNWYYHFSNVNDGGNRVPLFWLNPGGEGSKTIDKPISSRYIYHSLLDAIGIEQDTSLEKNSEMTFPMIQSFWYKHQGGTRDQYRYNQFLFEDHNTRFVRRNNTWMSAPLTGDNYHQEPVFETLNSETNPIQELVTNAEKKSYLNEKLAEFNVFSSEIKM
jgi:arylsulfatase A-like enzyme